LNASWKTLKVSGGDPEKVRFDRVPAGVRADRREIAERRHWRGDTLSRMRHLIKKADPDVAEEWKWTDTPVK
jgi:hypothetical protein